MYEKNLTLNNTQWLLCHKTKPNQTKPSYRFNTTAIVILQKQYLYYRFDMPLNKETNKQKKKKTLKNQTKKPPTNNKNKTTPHNQTISKIESRKQWYI